MHRAALLTALAPVLLWTDSALGEDPLETRAAADAIAALVAQPIPREFCLSDEDAGLVAGGGAWHVDFADSLAPHGFEAMEQTDGTLDRLISARRLELLTLMRSESAAVFFGVNEKGRLGVHVDASLLMRPAQ